MPQAWTMPIWIDETTGADRVGDTLLGGVPVERGALSAGGFFTLSAPDGRSQLVEGAPGAFWPDGSIKWLHLCGLVDLPGGKRSAFTLAPAASPPAERLQAAPASSRYGGERVLQIGGGTLHVEIGADLQNILSVVKNGAAQLISPGLSASLVLVGPDGDNRRELDLLLLDEKPVKVVETANRIVVRLAGKFVNPGGRDAGELILFFDVFRQSAELRIQPVFIFLGDPRKDLVAELSLTVHTRFGGDGLLPWKKNDETGEDQPQDKDKDKPASRYGFANQQGLGFWDLTQRIRDDERGGDGPRWPHARQVQLGSSFYVTEKRTGTDASWVKCTEGQRSQGWCCLANRNGGVTAGMRYFWQEYPRSLAVDADVGSIRFGLVPPEAAALDLRRYSQTIYGSPVYEASQGGFPPTHGATGIAKSSELMLCFGAVSPEVSARCGLNFANPIRPFTPPETLAATKVIGQLAPADPGKHADAESLATACTDFIVKERDVRGWYGLMNYGDILSAYYSELDRWAFDDGGYAWVNTEHLPDLGLWLQSLRSARPDWLEASVAMTRHNRDVDMYHRGMLKGLGSRHNVNHWGCQDKEWRVSMPLVKRLHYYLTADPWTAEVIRETVAVYQKYERTAGIAPALTGAFAGILARWEMDHDEEDARTLERFADIIASSVRDDGMFTSTLHVNLATGEGHPVGDQPYTGHFFMNGFGGQHALVEYAELTGNKKLSDAIIKHLDYYLSDRTDAESFTHRYRKTDGVMVFLAHAWRKTGDEKYRLALARAVAAMTVEFEVVGGERILEEPRHIQLAGMTRRNKVGCHVGGGILHQLAYGLAAL